MNLNDPDGRCPGCGVGAVVGGLIGGVGSFMKQATSGDGNVDFGRVALDAGKEALAGAVIGSGAGLIVAAGELSLGAGMMTAGAVSGGGTLVAETAGELVESATVAVAPSTGIANGGAIDPSFDAGGVAKTTMVAGTAGMAGPLVEKVAGPVVTELVGEVGTEKAATVTTTAVESITNTVSGYFNSYISTDDDD